MTQLMDDDEQIEEQHHLEKDADDFEDAEKHDRQDSPEAPQKSIAMRFRRKQR